MGHLCGVMGVEGIVGDVMRWLDIIFWPMILGVGCSKHFLKNVFRLSTFIFFSFTYVIMITKQKKFFRKIEMKKSPSHFTELDAGLRHFMLENVTKLENVTNPTRVVSSTYF